MSAVLTATAACSPGSKPTSPGGSPSGTAAHIVKVSGDSQAAPFNSIIPNPLVVKVTDSSGNPVSNASVAWGLQLFGASLSQHITTTNGNGLTQLSPMMSGAPGVFSINAAINPASVIFTGSSDVTPGSGVSHFQIGIFASCAVTAAGAGWCWGNGAGAELGSAAYNGPHTGPVPVAGGYTFSQVSVSTFLACAVATSGALYCWGDPGNGMMGNGQMPGGTVVWTPQPAGNGRSFTQVSVNDNQTCGMSGGAAYCWGRNQTGALGTGDTVSHWAPTAVKAPAGVTFASVMSGNGGFVCGLTTTGAAYCWGDNSSGQLGIGSSTPSQSDVPVAVTGGHTFTQLASGSGAACGLSSTGTVYCWGQAYLSGNGSASTEYAPTPITQSGLTFTQLTAGGIHACALTSSGAAYCWGSNVDGELGSGSFSTSGTTPVAVTGGYTFKTIGVGGLSSCALTTTNAVMCWGANSSQQLGLPPGSDTAYAAPVGIPGLQ